MILGFIMRSLGSALKLLGRVVMEGGVESNGEREREKIGSQLNSQCCEVAC